jgi:sulfopyruvate decarboxylase alpha subunit
MHRIPVAEPFLSHREWPDQIYRAFGESSIRQVAYVPDAGHTRLIELCHADPALNTISLTTEEEGIAMLAGGWLGGARGVLLMQSSGVGNCVNMLSLVHECRFPLLMVVTMRGEWGETNPWQVPMGQSTPTVLERTGVIVYHVDDAAHVAATVAAGAQLAFTSNRAVAVLLGQQLIGAKQFEK